MFLVVVPLLVTHTQEFQVERSGMTHVGTQLAPLGVDIAVGKLHEVEGILDIGSQVVEGYVDTWLGGVGILELTAQSA